MFQNCVPKSPTRRTSQQEKVPHYPPNLRRTNPTTYKRDYDLLPTHIYTPIKNIYTPI